MKVLLIEPSYSPLSLGFLDWIRIEPLALENIAGTISKQHEVRLLDMRIDTDLEGFFCKYPPDIVALTAYTTQVYIALEIFRRVKEIDPNTTTVVGGLHVTLCPQAFFNQFVDVIVLGEGEYSFKEIVKSKESGIGLAGIRGIIYRENGRFRRTGTRPLIENLDEIPLPDRTVVESYKENYNLFPFGKLASLYTAKGCTNTCKFCSVWITNRGRYRAKSARRVQEELEGIEEKNVFFVDDNFFADWSRSKELYHLLKGEGKKYKFLLVQSGVETVRSHPRLVECWRELADHFYILVGFETFENKQLEFLHKKVFAQNNRDCIDILRQNDVYIFGAFIVDPQYDLNDFEMLNEHLEESKMSFGQYTVLTPLPGTPFYKQKERELVIRNYELYDCLHSVLPTRIPRRDFYTQFSHLYRPRLPKRGSVPDSYRRILSEVGHIDYREWNRHREMFNRISDPQSYWTTEEGFVLGNQPGQV